MQTNTVWRDFPLLCEVIVIILYMQPDWSWLPVALKFIFLKNSIWVHMHDHSNDRDNMKQG